MATTFLAVLASALLPVRTHAEVIERVVVVVNDDAIFLSELRQEAAPYVFRAERAPTVAARRAAIEQTYAAVLERLIDRTLVEQAAEEDQIVVSDADVDRAISAVRERTGIQSRAVFWQTVAEQGFGTQAEYRVAVHAQLLHLRVLETRMGGRTNIIEADVRGRYEELVSRARLDGAPVAPYESVRMELYGALRQAALERQEATLLSELRRLATIERHP